MPGLSSAGGAGLEEVAVGTLTADGTEQTVLEKASMGTFEGWVDLSNMASGDVVVIKVYVKAKSGGSFRQYDSASYSNAQTNPAVHVTRLSAKYGIKITLQQTVGSYRSFDYNFFKRA